jgi:phytoene dehydrogenase-like protein
VPDAIVIGAGPNGLTAAAYLARAGMSVLVVEAKGTPGRATQTRELTLPGCLHDVGAAFFPFGKTSPALLSLELPSAGLIRKHAPFGSAHPARHGSCVSIARDLDVLVQDFGEDGAVVGSMLAVLSLSGGFAVPEGRAGSDSLHDLAAFTREVRAAALPSHPYLVIGQQSIADPTRATAGRHTAPTLRSEA